MTIAQSAAVAQVGIAKQASEGTPATDPTYALPVFENLPRPMQSVERFQVTDVDNQFPGLYKSMGHWEADFVIPALPGSLGAWLKGLLPTDNISGAGPYVHEMTPAGNDAFFSLFSRRPGGLYERFEDGLIEELTIQFSADMPVKVGVKAKGKTVTVLVGAYTPTTTEKLTQDGEYLTSIGGTLLLDVDATPAVTSVTNIVSGTVRVMRTTDVVQTAESFTPGVMSRGRYEVGVALDTVWQDFDAYEATYYGAIAANTLDQNVVMGSVDFTLACNGSATTELQLEVPNVALLVPEAPQPDASGAPFKVAIDGMAVVPSSGSIITATLTNDESTAY